MKKTFLIFLCLLILPLSVFAAYGDDPDLQGTIVITLKDAKGENVKGDWYLHQGSSQEGLVVRNGIGSDKFLKNPGNYFLEIRNTKTHGAYTLEENPAQSLNTKETITYHITYYIDEEAKLAAEEIARLRELGPAEPEPEPEEAEPKTEPEPQPEPQPETKKEPKAEPAPKPDNKPIVYAPDFSTPPDLEVLPFDKAPTNSTNLAQKNSQAEVAGINESLKVMPTLAQTGSSGLILLLPSVLGGLAFRRKR